ncbi:MAG: hypothetical protein WC554_19135 [Clostridia bacterium]|jgi:hypothetical protein
MLVILKNGVTFTDVDGYVANRDAKQCESCACYGRCNGDKNKKFECWNISEIIKYCKEDKK